MKCLCIDDEPLALNKICEYVRRVPFLELAGGACDVYEAMSILAAQKIDVLFTDINMPDLNGMEFVRSLEHRPIVIFTTAYSEYAIEGFKVDALDYLLKPFSFADFCKASNKAYKQYRLQEDAKSSRQVDRRPYFYVKADGRMVRIDYDNILYFEGQSEYVRIVLEIGKPVVTLLTMKMLESHLPVDTFKRVHRSFIVNVSKIVQVAMSRVTMSEETIIPIGDQYKDSFTTFIQQYFLSK
jgi:two-component system LytT family response regulator